MLAWGPCVGATHTHTPLFTAGLPGSRLPCPVLAEKTPSLPHHHRAI